MDYEAWKKAVAQWRRQNNLVENDSEFNEYDEYDDLLTTEPMSDCARVEAAAARHQHRAAIYACSYDKLNIKPNAPLETQWGELSSELVEIVAGHMEPREVVRLRNVSSGWRAALWQEGVVRASLHGIGPRVDKVTMYGLVMSSRLGVRAFKRHLEFAAGGADPPTIRWKPILDEMEQWNEYARLETHNALMRICCAVVPVATNATQKERLEELLELESLKRT